jgi:hypothetical protein
MEIDMVKAKKNEIVAIVTQHSQTQMHGNMLKYITVNLAQVTRCTRRGIVECIRKEPNGMEYMIDLNQLVLVISGANQALAVKLWSELGGTTFGSTEELKNAILKMAEKA